MAMEEVPMRSLTSTLLAAQKEATATPYVKVEVSNRIAGVVRHDWSRLYTGSEDDGLHSMTMPGDGSLVRIRVTPVSDSMKLYRQRVTEPDPESDFSQWTYTSEYNVLAVAAASMGAEVSIFWIKSNREIRRIKSTDNGASWGAPEIIDYSPTTAVNGMAAAYKPNGDIAVFFADQSTLYVREQTGGEWQTTMAWSKTTGDLSGVACVYDGDWNLLVTGKDTSDNYKLWSLVYGDGGDVASGSWSTLRELASAPAGGEYEYRQPFLDKTDVYRAYFVEKYSGTEAYSRIYWSHSVCGSSFIESLWREPVPFDQCSVYGLAVAHHGGYGWLEGPAGVWRAGLETQSIDLTADVIRARQEESESGGILTIELMNDDGRYASPGQGELAVLDIGSQVDFGLGYVTAAGNEYSPGLTFSIEALEHTSSSGRASLIIHAHNGRALAGGWNARNQFRWNKSSGEKSVREMISFVVARGGLKLEAKSESSVITGFYPDLTINARNDGGTVIRKLLSFVPDTMFFEGNQAYVVNPLSSDSSVYSYGTDHGIRDCRYRCRAWGTNRIEVEGYDGSSGEPILSESFAWDEINRIYDRVNQLEDSNLGTADETQQRGQSYLRQAEIEGVDGEIRVPINCGQQMFDVIEITDPRAGLDGKKQRVTGIVLDYNPQRGVYIQQLRLGAV